MSGSHRSRSVLALAVGVLLSASACTSGTAETTTSSSVVTTTVPTSTTTTTTTAPLVENGPGVAFEGDQNAVVEALQFLIVCNEYAEIAADGIFGPATLGAVQEVQRALGRETTGIPDDETLAILSRGCTEDRRIGVPEDGGERVVAGTAADGDPEIFFARADEGERLSVVVESESGEAVVSVRRTDGSAFGSPGVTVFAEDVETTGDYVIEVSTLDEAVTFTATVAVVELDFEDPAGADEDTIELDELGGEVTDVCLDTDGVSSFVAEIGPGHLVVTADTVGTFALARDGVGAPIEFVFKDATEGYIGFDLDFDIEIGDRIEGSGVVFRRGGDPAEPLPLAFSFERSAVPCEGGSGIPIVLSFEGLGVVGFGAGDEETLEFVRSALPSAAPTIDTGWIPIEAQNNEYGICRDGTTEVRVIEVDNLTLFFTSAGTTFGSAGTRHFTAFRADAGVFPFTTNRGIGPGSTLGDVLEAHPDAVAADGLDDGIDVFITSPPGDDRWLRATAADASGADDLDATITSVTGGRFCDG